MLCIQHMVQNGFSQIRDPVDFHSPHVRVADRFHKAMFIQELQRGDHMVETQWISLPQQFLDLGGGQRMLSVQAIPCNLLQYGKPGLGPADLCAEFDVVPGNPCLAGCRRQHMEPSGLAFRIQADGDAAFPEIAQDVSKILVGHGRGDRSGLFQNLPAGGRFFQGMVNGEALFSSDKACIGYGKVFHLAKLRRLKNMLGHGSVGKTGRGTGIPRIERQLNKTIRPLQNE